MWLFSTIRNFFSMSGINNIKCCTKGYTNQLKLCPTTEDYQQADSPPQPAQGPQSTNGAGGLNPKPLNWVANEKNYPVPCFHSTLSLHSPIHRTPINRYTRPSSLTTTVYLSFPGFHTRVQPHKNTEQLYYHKSASPWRSMVFQTIPTISLFYCLPVKCNPSIPTLLTPTFYAHEFVLNLWCAYEMTGKLSMWWM